MLVYDITNPKSFENLNQWKSDFINKACPRNSEQFPFFLVGNKADKAETERKVGLDYVKQWQKQNNNIHYEETSALNGKNVEVAFEKLARELLNQAMASENNSGGGSLPSASLLKV